MGDTILLRRGTAANLPDLQEGEPGFETDTGRLLIGTDAGTAAASISIGDYDYAPVTFTQAAIEDALTALGTTNKRTLLLRVGTWPITGDLTIPDNVTLKIPPGALLTIATTKTLTVNGPFDAGLYQVFNCTGTGKVVFARGSVESVSPVWFGFAYGTNDAAQATTNKTAIDLSVTALGSSIGGLIQFPAGTFVCDPEINPAKTNVHFQGIGTAYGYEDSTPGTTLVFTSGTYGLDLTQIDGTITNTSYTKIENIAINGNAVLAYGIGIKGIQLVNDVTVTGCTSGGIHFAEYTIGTHLNRVSLYKNTGYGLLVDGGTNTTEYTLTDVNIRENVGVGMRITAGQFGSLNDVIIESNTGVGLEIYTTSVGGISNMAFNNVFVEGNSTATATGYQVTIKSDDPTTNYSAYLTFDHFNVAAYGASGKGLDIDALRYSDFRYFSPSAGDAAHGADIDSYGMFLSFYESEQGNTIVDGGTKNTFIRKNTATGGLTYSAPIKASVFDTGSGVTASTDTATPVTIFSAATAGAYIVACYIATGTSANYHASAIIVSDGAVVSVTNGDDGSNMAITVSGTNVQATQTSGIAQVITYKYIKL